MNKQELDNELKYLEISAKKLKRMVDLRKKYDDIGYGAFSYKSLQCTNNDIEQVCNAIRKSSLAIKQHAHLIGRE